MAKKPKKPESKHPRGTHPKSLANLKPPWPPGESGNVEGRPSAGAAMKEWFNEMAAWPLGDVKAVLNDPKAPVTKRGAAIRVLRMVENPDMKDFEPYLNGAMSLNDLFALGVDTSLVKSAQETANKFGTDRKIELRDRSGEDFDRIMDRTVGRSTQEIKVSPKNEDPPPLVLVHTAPPEKKG